MSSNKAGIGGVIFLFGFIGISYLSGAQPFIPSEAYLNFLMYIAFPGGCLFFIYRLFKKDKASGITVFRRELNKRNTSLKRLGYIFIVILSIPFFSGLFTALSQWYPAWPSQYLYSKQTSFEAVIVRFGNLRKVNRTKIYLKDLQSGREFSVHWPKPDSRRLPTDAVVRLTGNQNWFGDYINKIELVND